MEDLAVFTALNHSGSFGKNFAEFKNNKICYLPAKGRPSQPANNIYSFHWKEEVELANALRELQIQIDPKSQSEKRKISQGANEKP